MDEPTIAEETKRERVRRLLIRPLTELGFRKSAAVKADDHAKTLDRLADDLTYMSDEGFSTLYDMLRSKGQGKDRDIWPTRASILGLAELVEPRPIEELPGLLRWFRSVEGPRARADGTLAETWSWFKRFKRPPIHARRQLMERADENLRRLQLIEERDGRGTASREDLDWARRYRDAQAHCERIVREGEAAREGKAQA